MAEVIRRVGIGAEARARATAGQAADDGACRSAECRIGMTATRGGGILAAGSLARSERSVSVCVHPQQQQREAGEDTAGTALATASTVVAECPASDASIAIRPSGLMQSVLGVVATESTIRASPYSATRRQRRFRFAEPWLRDTRRSPLWPPRPEWGAASSPWMTPGALSRKRGAALRLDSATWQGGFIPSAGRHVHRRTRSGSFPPSDRS
jgi:hypothetical protein